MRSFIKFLRGLGPLGTFIANVLVFLTTNWVVTMTTIISILAGFSDWATNIVQKPGVQTAGEIFLVLLWTYTAIVYLSRKNSPVLVTGAHDYRYGLTFEGLMPFYHPEIKDSALVFGIQLRNFSNGPIRYDVTMFDVRIGTRSLPKLKKGELYGYMPRGGGRVSTRPPFSIEDIKEFAGKKITGTADISITYGHPELPPVRNLIMSFELTLLFPAEGAPRSALGFDASIKEEIDIAI